MLMLSSAGEEGRSSLGGGSMSERVGEAGEGREVERAKSSRAGGDI